MSYDALQAQNYYLTNLTMSHNHYGNIIPQYQYIKLAPNNNDVLIKRQKIHHLLLIQERDINLHYSDPNHNKSRTPENKKTDQEKIEIETVTLEYEEEENWV